MNNFDWSTEEHGHSTIVTADKTASESGKGRIQKVVLVIFLSTLFVALAYWQLDRRFDAQTAVYEADVLASFRVWQQAITQSDEELFNSLLVGTDPAWAASQRRHFMSGFFLDRSQLDLALAVEEGYLHIEDVEIDLSPDLSSAEVSFQQVYNMIDNSENTFRATGKIQLAYDLYFQRKEDRWYLALPPENYWGEWQIEEKSLLTLTYPERDENWALQLAQDLEADLMAACEGATAKICSEEETVELRLETKNAYNMYQKGWRPSLVNRHTIVIPTFSLIGRPNNESDYNHYYSFYMRFILDFFTTWIENPIPIKDREIQLNCFPPDARSLSLVSRISGDGWVIDIPKQSYRYLWQPEHEEGDGIDLEVDLQDIILDYPYLRFPDESGSLTLSLDGRWISTNLTSPDLFDTWLIYTYDTQLIENHRYAVRYPSTTSLTPYYGWSEDGIWLVVVDQNYLRLIAPAYNYERLISHDPQNCVPSG